MSLRDPMPPDLTLGFARLEACHFGVRLEGTNLGNMILRVSERPQVMDAMQKYQPPQAVPLDGFDRAVCAIRLLGENLTQEEVGMRLGVKRLTIQRDTKPLYLAFGTACTAATVRRLIEQDSIRISELPHAALGRIPLTKGEKLLGYVMSRGWSIHSLKKHSGINCTQSNLFDQASVKNMTALTMSLFARGQLMPDPELHNLWKQSGGYPAS
jgi:hypothetical protein